MKTNKYKVATLCGSTKAKSAFYELAEYLSLNGYIILMPIIFAHEDTRYNYILTDREILDMFSKKHQQMIDMADVVWIVDKDQYIGSATRSELKYAQLNEKEIKYYSRDFRKPERDDN